MQAYQTKTYPFTLDKNAPCESIVETLEAYGIVHIPNYLNLDNIQIMEQELDDFLNNFQQYDTKEESTYCSKVKANRCDIKRESYPFLVDTFSDPFMESIALKYLGENSNFNEVMWAEKHYNEDDNTDKPIPITDPHFDIVSSLKFFLYLDDSTTENGAFQYAPGTHKTNLEQTSDFYLKGGKVLFTPNVPLPSEAEELVPMEGPAGTMLIFDSYGFHGGSFINGRTQRRTIRFHSFRLPKLALYPKKLSRQWLRESFLNPRKYFSPAPKIPSRPTTEGSAWMRRQTSVR